MDPGVWLDVFGMTSLAGKYTNRYIDFISYWKWAILHRGRWRRPGHVNEEMCSEPKFNLILLNTCYPLTSLLSDYFESMYRVGQ